MNFNFNQSTQFLQNKINQNNHFLNQQQQISSRYVGLNANQYIANSNNLTSSPPLNGQFNSGLISIGQQQIQPNFPMVSPNMMYQNTVNHLNFNNNPATQQQK